VRPGNDSSPRFCPPPQRQRYSRLDLSPVLCYRRLPTEGTEPRKERKCTCVLPASAANRCNKVRVRNSPSGCVSCAQSGSKMNCKACRSSLSRRHRHGLVVRHLLSLIGFYPWECLNCGMSYYFHRRKTLHLDQSGG
jgi:hypothetical protein